MTKRILGVSLKMYFSLSQTVDYVRRVAELASLADSLDVDLFVVPDFLGMTEASKLLSGTSVMLGAQDCCDQSSGAFTGEISPAHLAELNVKLVELGHAERRRLYGETDESAARKASAAVSAGLIPLVCIGEQQQASSQAAVDECSSQITSLLQAVGPTNEVIFAYEPVWAIGAAEPASADYVTSVAAGLRKVIANSNHKAPVRIIYGGSAKPGLYESLKSDLDGLFLGRFAHNIENLKKCLEEVGAK